LLGKNRRGDYFNNNKLLLFQASYNPGDSKKWFRRWIKSKNIYLCLVTLEIRVVLRDTINGIRMEKADQILELLKCGDKGGLELLFRHFYRPLVMYALKFVFFQEEAEDIVQEVFVKFWEQRKFDQVNHFLRSYLYQSVKNRCLSIMELKRGISMTSMDSLLDFSDSEAPDESEWDERVNQIYREIDRLPERTRVIFMAVVMEGKRYKEVADDLNISLNTVKTALSRALSTLRSNLNDKTFLFLFRLFTRK